MGACHPVWANLNYIAAHCFSAPCPILWNEKPTCQLLIVQDVIRQSAQIRAAFEVCLPNRAITYNYCKRCRSSLPDHYDGESRMHVHALRMHPHLSSCERSRLSMP